MPIRLGPNTGFSHIGFRGDDRSPNKIFLSGFESRDMKKDITLSQQLVNFKPPDIESETAVSFSARVTAAAMFPLRDDFSDPQTSDTYVYGVVVDEGVFNTFFKQATFGLNALRNWETLTGRELDAVAAKIAFWPLYAHEMATKRIPNTHIVGAIKVTRTWAGMNWKSGATFKYLEPVLTNINCAIDKKTKKIMMDVLVDFVHDGQGKSPLPEKGYHPSFPKQLPD